MSEEVTEEWRPVVGYEGLYEVSNMGNVRNARTQKTLKSQMHRYPALILYKPLVPKGSQKTRHLVHRLVAEAFLPNIDNKPVVDHIDGNNANNSVANLRWVTQYENVHNPITAQRHRQACMTPAMIEKTRRNFFSTEALAKRSITIQRPDIKARMLSHAFKNKAVRCIETGEIFQSASAAASAYHISVAAVSASCRLSLRGRT